MIDGRDRILDVAADLDWVIDSELSRLRIVFSGEYILVVVAVIVLELKFVNKRG